MAYFATILLGIKTFSVRSMIGNFLPVNYFLVLYVTLYWISPYINIMMQRLDDQHIKLLLGILVILFSVFPTFLDQFNSLIGQEYNGLSTIGVYGSQWGYSIVNFVLMYVIGSAIRRYKERIGQISSQKYLLAVFICVGLISMWELFGEKTGFIGHNSALEYCNPLVILEAVVIFCLFYKMEIGQNRILNAFAKQSFAVFILQNNFIRQLRVANAVNSSPGYYLAHLILSGVMTYIVCSLIGMAFDYMTKPLFRVLRGIGDRHTLQL